MVEWYLPLLDLKLETLGSPFEDMDSCINIPKLHTLCVQFAFKINIAFHEGHLNYFIAAFSTCPLCFKLNA